MSGHCEHCRRRRPQLKVKVGERWMQVCPNCAAFLCDTENAELEAAANAPDEE